MKTFIQFGLLILLTSCSTPLTEQIKRAFEEYKSPEYADFKAFAADPDSGAWGRSWIRRHVQDAIDGALRRCNRRGKNCEVYAVGNTVVSALSPENRARFIEKYEADVYGGDKLGPKVKTLSSEEIKSYFSGATVKRTSLAGTVVIENYSANGDFVVSRKATRTTSGWTPHGIIESMDRDNDGKVSLAEYARSKNRFYRIDRDSDGYITLEEVANVLARLKKRQSDRGKWWVNHDKKCVSFKKWFNSRTLCTSIVKSGEIFKVYFRGELLARSVILKKN